MAVNYYYTVSQLESQSPQNLENSMDLWTMGVKSDSTVHISRVTSIPFDLPIAKSFRISILRHQSESTGKTGGSSSRRSTLPLLPESTG